MVAVQVKSEPLKSLQYISLVMVNVFQSETKICIKWLKYTQYWNLFVQSWWNVTARDSLSNTMIFCKLWRMKTNDSEVYYVVLQPTKNI